MANFRLAMGCLSLKDAAGEKLDVVLQTKIYLSSDPRSAEQYLQKMRENIPMLLTKLKEYEKEHGNSLLEELMRQKCVKERELSILRDRIESYEAERAKYNALLEDARSDLKRSARSDMPVAIGSTVADGIGAVFLGILFPPSLIVTVPAAAVAGTISIKSADDKIDRCNDRIRSAEKGIANENRRIAETNQRISSIEGDMYALRRKEKALHSEIGEKRKSIVSFKRHLHSWAS